MTSKFKRPVSKEVFKWLARVSKEKPNLVPVDLVLSAYGQEFGTEILDSLNQTLTAVLLKRTNIESSPEFSKIIPKLIELSFHSGSEYKDLLAIVLQETVVQGKGAFQSICRLIGKDLSLD